MLDLSKAFPERVALAEVLTARQKLADEGRNPFGGEMQDGERANLEKLARLEPEEIFANLGKLRKSPRLKIGDRVVITATGEHGHVVRWTGKTPGDPIDDPHMVHVRIDGDSLAIGKDVQIEDLEPEDETVSMDCGGRAHVAPDYHLDHSPEVVRAQRVGTGQKLAKALKIELSDAAAGVLGSLARGENVQLDPSNRKSCEQHDNLRKLISIGRIRFEKFRVGDRVRHKPGIGPTLGVPEVRQSADVGTIAEINMTHAAVRYSDGRLGTALLTQLEAA